MLAPHAERAEYPAAFGRHEAEAAIAVASLEHVIGETESRSVRQPVGILDVFQDVAGGAIYGNQVVPTVLVGAGPDLRVNTQEVFAPVVTVQTYTEFEAALRAINASVYGLQAGVFTRDIGRAFAAFEELGADLNKNGLPFLTVLDSDGKPLANQETGSLELSKEEAIYGCQFEGTRYDCGDKLGCKNIDCNAKHKCWRFLRGEGDGEFSPRLWQGRCDWFKEER